MKYLPLGTALALVATIASAPFALATPSIPITDISRVFSKVSSSPTLANPSMILVDQGSGEIVFQKEAATLRTPASVLKLLSTTAALTYLDPNYRYVTKVSNGVQQGSIVISGSFDPWMTGYWSLAHENHQAYLPHLADRAIADLRSEQKAHLRKISIKYSGLYGTDVNTLKHYFASRGIYASMSSVSSERAATLSGPELASVTSPTISEMVRFALTWSDNLLAERLARAAAHALHFPMNEMGVSAAIKSALTDLNINQSGLFIYDGSGLSHKDRVTARLIADLLLKIREDKRYLPIYEGLPVSGKSGTLESRFINTAPQAVGLIHAKTGTLNGTISLAGYVDSGTHEYVFVALVDHIHKGTAAADQARNTLDRLLGRITAPLEPAPLSGP